MSFLDYFKVAFDLAKKAQSVELQGALLSMREDYNTLQERNIELQARVKELEAAQVLAANLEYRELAYYLKKERTAHSVSDVGMLTNALFEWCSSLRLLGSGHQSAINAT